MKRIALAARWSTIVLYGPSGGGKTTLAGTAPKPLFADSNQGVLSIATRPGFERVCSEDVHSIEDLERIYDNCTGTGPKDWSSKFETIVFDHFDDIQDIVLNELGEKRVARERAAGREGDPDQIEQREYGVMGNRLRRFIRKFKRVPMHKILICGEKEDRETGRMRPSMVGALAQQLPYFADHTLYLRIGSKNRRFLHLNSTDLFYAKTRAWWIPDEKRKILVPFDDTTFMTDFLARIAAGPRKRSSTTATGDDA